MNPELKFFIEIERAMGQLTLLSKHSDLYINYGPEQGSDNWKIHDRFTIGATSQGIDFIPGRSLELTDFKLEFQAKIRSIYDGFLPLCIAEARLGRYFAFRFFRQAEVCFGFISLYAERLKIMMLLHSQFRNILPLEKFPPYNLVGSELYFLKHSNRLQPPDMMLYFLAQQAHIDQCLFSLFLENLADPDCAEAKSFAKLVRHSEEQISFVLAEINKTWALMPELKKEFSLDQAPRYLYLEKSPPFGRFFAVMEKQVPDFFSSQAQAWNEICAQNGLGQRAGFTVSMTDVKMSLEEGREYARATKEFMEEHKTNITELMRTHAFGNDELLRTCLSKVNSNLKLQELLNPGVYEYYLQEQKKVQWHFQDVEAYLGQEGIDLTVTDNDHELFDVIKEIGYCEAASYTIGYCNLVHMGYQNHFVLWNTQQCHEELKHFHAIRAAFHKFGVCTENLDEQFLAQAHVEPSVDSFNNQYDVFLINFLGETHNIRAYLMLADSLDNVAMKKLLRWIAEDEVVHKKVFAAFFQYMCRKDPKYERNVYESMMDKGLVMHQAKVSPHYYLLMKKIGNYYGKAEKTNALKFLNMSMRAQYLELKSLFSEDIFKVSEYDFRKKHLPAYAFDV